MYNSSTNFNFFLFHYENSIEFPPSPNLKFTSCTKKYWKHRKKDDPIFSEILNSLIIHSTDSIVRSLYDDETMIWVLRIPWLQRENNFHNRCSEKK